MNATTQTVVFTGSYIRLLPLFILSAGMVIILLVIAFRRSHPLIAGLTLATLAFAFATIPFIASQGVGTASVTPLLIMDSYAEFIIGLILLTAIVITLLAYGYLNAQPVRREEFYILLLTASLGGSVLAASNHFAAFFLGLEILSLSLYALIGYTYDNPISIEAGIKYLVLAGASSAFLLFGMALIYYDTATMEFPLIADALTGANSSAILLAGLALLLVGISFKLALVPFHMWTPDVYEGSPAPVTAFVATISKGSMFAVMVRFFSNVPPPNYPPVFTVFVIIAIVTMLGGNLLALLQNNLKRILAYSSIANLGYLLVAFLAGGTNGISASSFYLVSYFATTLAAFGVVTVLSSGHRSAVQAGAPEPEGLHPTVQAGTPEPEGLRDAGPLDDYRGLMWSHPWLAAILTAAMLSLAGLPLTAGFVGKFYLVLAGVGSTLWLLVIVLVISSAIGLYYYLRVVVMMYSHPTPEMEAGIPVPAITPAGSFALGVLLLLVVWLGVYPTPLVNLIQAMVRSGF